MPGKLQAQRARGVLALPAKYLRVEAQSLIPTAPTTSSREGLLKRQRRNARGRASLISGDTRGIRNVLG